MGRDKAFVEIDGVPLWQRQLRLLLALEPRELFISGPVRAEWTDLGTAVLPDVKRDAGPLAGLTAALRRSSSPLLLALAVDLPNMTADYLCELLTLCTADCGMIPRRAERFEPLAAVFACAALPLAERGLESGDYSVQQFAARCVSEGLARAKPIATLDEPLFLNMNTPADLFAMTKDR